VLISDRHDTHSTGETSSTRLRARPVGPKIINLWWSLEGKFNQRAHLEQFNLDTVILWLENKNFPELFKLAEAISSLHFQ